MKPAQRHLSSGPLGLDPTLAGTLCCAISALGYAGASICMRNLAGQQGDLLWSMWAVCNKELITVVAVGPWLLYRVARRLPLAPSGRMLAMLVAVAFAVQLAANLPVQWAFGKIGLAITVPAIFGVMLTSSAAMGLLLLGERVGLRNSTAIVVLLLSLAMLAAAARTGASEQWLAGGDLWLVSLGVGAACLAGAVYALLTIAIRHANSQATPLSTIVFVTTFVGVLSLGSLSISGLGTERLLQTSAEQFGWMYAAGILNLIAFLAITKGLELASVVRVNVLNASQVAMAAVAGTLLFGEPPSFWLVGGVLLTIVGVLMNDRSENADRTADRHL